MFSRKICSRKLRSKFKFCAVISIIYLKLNNLSATPLFETDKIISGVGLKPPDAGYSDDKKNPIEYSNVVSAKVESGILSNNEINDYYNYTVSGNSGENGKGNTTSSTVENNDNDDLVHDYILQFSANGDNSCMLDGLKEHMMMWAHSNGSLVMPPNIRKYCDKDPLPPPDSLVDASYRTNVTDELLAEEVPGHSARKKSPGVIAFSAAFDNLTYAPYLTLYRMRNTLQYLMLKGNNFSQYRPEADSVRNEQRIAWATFPELPQLRELDISNCMIEYVSQFAFRNLTNLTTLYMSHNKIYKIPSEAFHHVPNLRYLDLSHLSTVDVELPAPLPSVEQLLNAIVGVRIEQYTFKDLPRLEYLDLSYTKLTRSSALAFSFVGEKLRYLSLCFTGIPVIGSTMFKGTNLRGLDLSGNSYAAYTLAAESFSSVANTLEFLFFEQSNLKDLLWLKKLRSLNVLNLNSNNINSLTLETFRTLTKLQVLDLSSNHIGNWYTRIFKYNVRLKILNLRDNNINILTSEMLKDFQDLDYLGIGDNNFVCDCVLRDFLDIATANNKKAECVNNVFTNSQVLVQPNINSLQFAYTIRSYELSDLFDGYMATVKKYLPMLSKSYQNIRQLMERLKMYNLRLITSYYRFHSNNCPNPDQIIIYDKINGSTLKFQLLDYEDEHYWCFNETEKLNFFELNCESRALSDAIVEEIRNITNYVVIVACAILLLSIVVFVIYLKRWHIYYYYSSLKSAALLAVAAKENGEKFKEFSESDSTLMYDIFISYCQSDREWVLDELMPNIETAGDMSICMHERDFQVGITILDNIISCMDRSRCLMLVISSNFLLSHWCQFEMRLAQHRMFDASKEHLIIVFLEDIPKRKRPKTLQYLMEVKTYIKWPSTKSPNAKWDEKKIFWKRLRKSIKNISWDEQQRI